MKQHITVEQLNELTDEQKNKLRQLWKPQEGDFITSDKDDRIRIIGKDNRNNGFAIGLFPYCDDEIHACNTERLDKCFPLLSIGRMIELLESEYQTVYTSKHIPDGMFKTTVYKVFFKKDGCGFWGETLCDALWEAVKTIL